VGKAELQIQMTREEVAHKMHSQATARVRRLEQEMHSTFEEVTKAQEEMRSIGVVADIEMKPAMSAAFVEYKALRRNHETTKHHS
jgi:hypothetical protein